MKTEKQKLIKENDKIWSLLVRIRDNFKCQICGKYSKHTEAMHIFGCGWKATRWDTRNGLTGCYYCHRFKMHGGRLSEEEKKQLLIKIISQDLYDELYRKSREPVKFNFEFVSLWNHLLRTEFLNMTGMTYEEFLKEQRR
ncbi:MAG: hypothetical protein GX452_11805 [Ignavibacteriales bacterium]|nr:hypothetical protein [Ignavibacteriales bacterium]